MNVVLKDDKRWSLQSLKNSKCYDSQKSRCDSTFRLLLSICAFSLLGLCCSSNTNKIFDTKPSSVRIPGYGVRQVQGSEVDQLRTAKN